MSDKDVDLKIGADSSQADAEFNKVANNAQASAAKIQASMREASYNMASTMKEASEGMSASLEKVQAAGERLNKAFVALAVVLAGGAAMKESVEASVEMTKSAMGLGKQLGITATEASILNVALDDVYVSQDTMTAANQRLTKTLGTNEKAFKDLGVSTRDSNGNFRSSLDIMLDTNTALLKFKEGIDRNVEGQKIYGKSWGEVQGILKLTKEGMEESAAKARELGLVVGQENVEATQKYRAAMNDANDVIEASKKAVGDALLPVLTQLGEWFSSIGPQAVTVIKGAIGGLVSLFWGFKFAVEATWQGIAYAIEATTANVMRFADTAMHAMQGDFKGAKAAWEFGTQQIQDIAQKRFNNVVQAAEEARTKIANLFSAPTDTVAKTGGATSDGKEAKTKTAKTSVVAEWKEQLQLKLEAEQNYFKDSLKDEIEFWQQKLALTKAGSKERHSVEHELFTLKKRQAQEELQNEIAELKRQSEAYQAGGTDRIRIAEEIAQKIGDKYGLESKEYKDAMTQVQSMAKEHQKQLEKLDEMRVDRARQHSINEIEIQRDALKTKRDLQQITEVQELQALLALEEQEYQIAYQAQQDKAALITNDVVAQQAAYDKLAEMAEKHAQQMGKITGQVAVAQRTETAKMFEPITSAFEKSIGGIIQGTTSLKKAFGSIFQSIALEFANLGAKMLVNWVLNQTGMTAATTLGVAQRNAAEQAGAGQSMLISATTSIKKILNAAWETFSGVFSFLSGFMGPAAAGPALASMGTVAAAAGSIAFAERGYDIPAGVNPMAQLHQKEMVLPKEQAEVIRGLSSGGSAPIHIHTSGGDFIHKDDMAKVLKKMGRNFVMDNSPFKRVY